MIEKCIALALLPASQIADAYRKLSQMCRKKFGKSFDRFLEYYEKTWIKGYGPQAFSVFDQINRTNNSIESYHRVLNSKIRGKLDVAAFLSKRYFSKFFCNTQPLHAFRLI